MKPSNPWLLVLDSDRPSLMPSEGVLALHHLHSRYTCLAEFMPQLAPLLQQASFLGDCISVTHALGILEPLTGDHIPPEAIHVEGSNYRESLIANGLLSRNRAMLLVLEEIYGSLETLRQKDVYLVEALTGFAIWLQRQLGQEHLLCSEFLESAEQPFSDIPHQDLCALTFSDVSFDVVLCNELFGHVVDLDKALCEISRVLRPGGRLVATSPMAFGQQDSIIKAHYNAATGEAELLDTPEFHGDPIRPEAGALVYRVPGWELTEQLQAAGFGHVLVHHISSWKHGVLGADLPGVLVIEAHR